ncbi:hypothetical protein [Aquibacillus rhizosphaerae]|uniref:Uncharacterized protein n=1 Tax=Aquibacillus rhizosphaerae TaxID=3051431 RepID=A0ABT7L9W1_9BACI|nr:hypothetical protein [Aquibacillus sp. LR5S19]MDL4842642.1 hypothetical protein [Aquibacillus sp. LR5S19]
MNKWTLLNKDLYILVKMLGGKVLIGTSNPFPNYSEEDMEKEWELTFKKLHKLDLVDLIDGELKFEDSFISAIWVIARSNFVVEILTDYMDKNLFYFSDERVIECEKVNEVEITVVEHSTPDWTWNQILLPRMLMGIKNIPTRTNDTLLLIPKDYERYCEDRMIYNLDQVIANNELDNNSLIIKQFTKAVQRRIYTNRLMIYYWQNNSWNVEGTHVLSSPSYNWTLRMINLDGVEWLQATQASGASLVKELVGVMERVKEEQLV